MANYAIMLMMMSCRRITHILKRAEIQEYLLKGKMGREISQCTIGVIGTGRIGRSVLQHLSGFGCCLLGFSVHQNSEVSQLAEYVNLETLYKESDIISIHVPSVPQNYHMINGMIVVLYFNNNLIYYVLHMELIYYIVYAI
ncbi:NAD(P)-dependent oxidoreductase [Clostridium magnum]|uniref:Phenyllactate dehydrogenase n=1 Tax=Clostridium magnum DSM 2767 TaxID=1121326 RepID=A0A162S976_9CLOT|nr:NAD(P)-dependent oxidoreductase [Clostridium magnum]KZL90934.1 phenyllactate dehydrogenase [Clostridium magnum DSM 2767]SHJ01380.1 D-isomer specific 2-hydroxyacid dehydrogenase, NAD binding domain [Clostridium magnum DSM 2767]